MKNFMVVGLSSLSIAMVAMDKNQNRRPLSQGAELALWQRKNMWDLKVERHNNVQELDAELRLNLKLLELEQKRSNHALCMDRESYLQRYGTSQEYFAYKLGIW